MSDSRRLTIGQNTDSGPINISNYMTILALEDGLTASLSNNACQYCVDGDGNWIDLPSGTTTQAINQGQTLSFKGNLTPNYSNGVGTFTISKKCNLEGNCMSMLYGDDAVNNNSLSLKTYAFRNLFSECTTIIQVSESFLPATTLADYCYRDMFYGCTSLTTAPELPATKLASECYRYMFYGCTSLTSAPELPATKLADYCYQYMFQGCRGLTTAPELPATTLASNCYSSMFYGCSSLKAAPELPATTLARYCYYNMFQGCTSLTTVPSTLPATTLAGSCYCSMFQNCSSLTVTPELPATKLADYCYQAMFSGCRSLTTTPELPATTLITNCYSYMFSGCTSLTTVPSTLPATTLASNCYREMFYGCSGLTSAPELPATKLASSCYYYMFSGCSGLTTAPELPATTLSQSCYGYMFSSCSSLTTAPELPATTLAEACYYRMFYGCTKLNYIKMLATNIATINDLNQWVYNVASTGTFVKNTAMTSLPSGISGIPSGWTVVDDGEESGNLITFTVDGSEYQAEEGMTFYDWGMSEYYDSSINLTTASDMTFRESCELHGNTSIICFNGAGVSYTPAIYLNSIIQPISYILDIGGFD